MSLQRLAHFLCIIALASLASIAHAWSAGGHKIIGVIAYRHADNATRAAVLKALENHPRYQEDFLDPLTEELKNPTAEERGEWLFAQAAIWPDMARSLKGPDARFHHGNWHYLDLPIYLTPADATALDLQVDVNATWSPNTPPKEMNILFALQWASAQLADTRASKHDKALAICWLMHLAGDIHQPCHASSLYSQRLFPKGDHGGNAIAVGSSNLHSKWDGLLGEKLVLKTVLARAASILGTKANTDAANAAVNDMRPEFWLQDSRDLAANSVYTAPILDQLRTSTGTTKPAITLDDAYLNNAKTLAARQAAIAGYRLSEALARFRN